MSRARQMVVAAVAVVAALAALLVLIHPAAPDDASSFSRRSRGLLLARRYLEARGVRCTTLTATLAAGEPAGGALLLAFPAMGERNRTDLLRIRRWVRRGGTLIVLFEAAGPSPGQRAVLKTLGVATVPIRRRTELDPIRWWRRAHTPWELSSAVTARPVLVSSGLHVAIETGDEDRVVLEEKGHHTVLGLVRGAGRGRLVVLPSEALSNGRLLEAGNAGLLEWLRRFLGHGLAFDERLHGFGTPTEGGAEGTPMADALLVQLALIYLLALAALSRPQGPPWPEEPARGGSVGGMLLRLGAVHRRMGHHDGAARAMVERAAALGGWESVPGQLLGASRHVDGPGLVRLGRMVARRQERDRRKER